MAKTFKQLRENLRQPSRYSRGVLLREEAEEPDVPDELHLRLVTVHSFKDRAPVGIYKDASGNAFRISFQDARDEQ